jgi:hypothetical protein
MLRRVRDVLLTHRVDDPTAGLFAGHLLRSRPPPRSGAMLASQRFRQRCGRARAKGYAA